MNFFKNMFGGECEPGTACATQFGATSSLSQGANFAKMTAPYHGGRRTRRSRRMRGGASELATYPGGFETLPTDMHSAAGDASQLKAFAELGQFRQMGGRRTRRNRQRGGIAEVTAPSMILTPQEEGAAFLNPQWYNENVVNPNFQGPASPYVKATGGSRKHRKASRKNRKASRKNRKASRKNRKASRKNRKASRKNMTGGKRHRKASRKASKKSRKH